MGLENSTDEASIGLMDLSLSGKVGLRSIVCYVSTTVLAVILGIILVTSIQPGAGGLDEDEVFGTVAVFNVVRIPMNQFPRFLMESVKLLVSLRKIDSFLNCEDLASKSDKNQDPLNEHSIEFEKASFSWLKDPSTPTFEGLNLKVKRK